MSAFAMWLFQRRGKELVSDPEKEYDRALRRRGDLESDMGSLMKRISSQEGKKCPGNSERGWK